MCPSKRDALFPERPPQCSRVALLRARLLFLQCFCSPRRHNTVHTRIRDRLPQHVVSMHHQDVHHVPIVRFRSKLFIWLGKIRIGHSLHRRNRSVERLIPCLYNFGLVRRGLFECLPIETFWRLHPHHVRDFIVRAGGVHENLRHRAHAIPWPPRHLVGGKRLGQTREFLLHVLQVQKRLRLHVITRRCLIRRLRRSARRRSLRRRLRQIRSGTQ